jgi:hypothetical protein
LSISTKSKRCTVMPSIGPTKDPKVFTKDAVFDGRPCGGNDLYEGIDAISAWFALGKPPHPKAHHLMNCRLD